MTTRTARTGRTLLPWLVLAVMLHANIAAIAYVVHRLFPGPPLVARNEPLDERHVEPNELSADDRAALERDTGLSLAPPVEAPDQRTE